MKKDCFVKIAKGFGFSAILAVSVGVSAQTFQTNGSWNTSGNWNPASVPSGTGTNVTLSADPTISSTNVIGNVSVNNNVTIVVNAAGGSLTLGSSALFSVPTKKSMTFNNNGTIQINGGTPDGVIEIWGDLIVNNNLTLQVTGNFIVHGDITMNNNATVQVTGGGTVSVGGSLSGGSNTVIQVTGGGSALSVTGSINITGGGSSSISVSGGGSVSAGACSCASCSGSNGCSTDVTLPVTLLFFTEELAKDFVKLKWATGSELNFDYFDIERSANATDFTSIGKVTGHGTTNVRNDYNLVDEKPLIGKNYYRLKSVDFDSYAEYFKVLAVDFSGDKNFLISPNPSDGASLGFSLNFTPSANSTIIVFDNLNNIVGAYKLFDYTQNIAFTNPLKGGVYYAKLIAGDFVKVERFIVR